MAATLGTDTYPEGRLKSLIETVFRKLGDAAKRSRKLRSDIDTVEVVLRLLKERNCLSLLEEFLETLETPAGANKKNDQLAKEHREAGNKLFQKKKFKEALELYSQSIVTAKPAFEGGEDALPLAYANRSAVFFHLKLYKECKNDIEQAMQTGYPDNLRYKLLQRKGQCHLCEGELELAATAFQSSIELCTQYDVDPQKKDMSRYWESALKW
ncbi:protein-lysine N-methyltransferase SMYD4-like [Saccoglossus kowalevskii]